MNFLFYQSTVLSTVQSMAMKYDLLVHS